MTIRQPAKVKCCRCRNIHFENERLDKRDLSHKKLAVYDKVCPRCQCKSYYILDAEEKA
jgi:Zn finger protein HypA/HybF involved in hydrogenase expression